MEARARMMMAIAATPKFRGYFARSGAYADRYTAQNHKLCDALAKVPAGWAHPDPANPTYILTEHRIGYRFEKQSPARSATKADPSPPAPAAASTPARVSGCTRSKKNGDNG